ncbi:MAG: hypothetical protein ACSHWT_11760 [Glaciecola sp.]
MIKSKILKVIIAVLIVGYVGFGILSNFTGPSTEDFYDDFSRESEKYRGNIYNSMAYENKISSFTEQQNRKLASCLLSADRTVANLGENKNDKFYYISLKSNEYEYKLGVKWRIDTGVAYVTGIENRIDLSTGEQITPSGIGKIGGGCLHKFLTSL